MKKIITIKKITLIFLIIVAAVNTPIYALSASHHGDEKENSTYVSALIKGLSVRDVIDQGISMDAVSGPTGDFPWINEGEFVEACEKNGTGVLLGGYRAVLRDPLPGEEYNVHLAASMLAGIVVKPGQVFSQNQSIGPYTEDKGFKKGPTYFGTTLTTTVGGGVCKIASTLYNAAVMSNLTIIERHNHTMPVPYVPYGQDATVAYGVKDFRFRNDTGDDIMIWAKGVDNILYMAIYGKHPSPIIEWTHEVLEIREAPFQYKTNPNLEPDSQRIVVEGMYGALIKSWVTITTGDEAKVKYMGISDYKPMPYLIEKGGS